jgi:hypothetical protein
LAQTTGRWISHAEAARDGLIIEPRQDGFEKHSRYVWLASEPQCSTIANVARITELRFYVLASESPNFWHAKPELQLNSFS